MQAIILAAGRGYRLNTLTKNNTKCMVKINDVTLIERMINQLSQYNLDRIIIVDGYQKENLERFVAGIKTDIPISYIENCNYLETNNIYSLYLAKEYLCCDDTIVLDSDIIFEDQILFDLINNRNSNVAVIDIYKNWMTGEGVILNENNEVVGFKKENEIDHLQIRKSFKTVGMYKFSTSFFKDFYLPFLEAYIKVYGSDGKYTQVLSILTADGRTKVNTCQIGDNKWYEINDIQDIDLASTLFSDDEEVVSQAMLGRWGGYWRYPEYLDYFYLVTPYYPTSAIIEEMKANFEDLLMQYPSGLRVNSLLAAKEFFVEPENIIIGNGAAELIKSIMSRINGNTGFIRPTFDEYPNRISKEKQVNYHISSNDFRYNSKDIIDFFNDKDIENLVLVNPENPSGNYIDKASMNELLVWTKAKGIKLIVDESFVDFVDENDPTLIKQSIIEEYPNLYVLKSISKSYGVPGLRLGVLVSGDKDTIEWMKKDVSIWNINSFAEFYMQIAGKYRKDYYVALEKFRKERKSFEYELSLITQMRVIPSQANYVMVELLDGIKAEWLKRTMLINEKILIKTLNKKIDNGKQYIRFAIRNHKDNMRLIDALHKIFDERSTLID